MTPNQSTPWRRISTVLRKEVSDHLRDKRSMVLSLVFPLLAPLTVALLLHLVAGANVGGLQTRTISIQAGIVGGEYAPELVKFLKINRFTLEPAPAGQEAREKLVTDSVYPFVLVIPEAARGSDIYQVQVIVDRTNPRSTAGSAEVMRIITAYGRIEAERQVKAAGLSEKIVNPVAVEQVNVGRAANAAYLFYNMVPSLVLFMVFMGAVYLAIDTSVGERERGSLEPLLTAPVARWELLMGKSIAALMFTALIVAVNLAAFRMFLVWAVAGAEGMASPPSVGAFVGMYLVALPLMMLAVSIQMTIATLSRSAKEAQIYLGLLPVIPLVPGIILVFAPIKMGMGLSAVPILGQLSLFLGFVGDRDISFLHILVSSLSAVIAAGFVFMLATRLFSREKMVFGT
ncbi:MAG: ABC transporter permease subunit [Sphingomonadales bacterium]